MPDEAVKKALEADRVISDRSRAEAAERLRGRPTPTQEENDRAKLGEHILTHEDDGSGPDLNSEEYKKKHAQASSTGASYSTRTAKPSS